MGLIFISHDLELVATFCDRVAIMYAGRVVEVCRAAELHAATHPYTRGLLGCLPRLDRPQQRLPVLVRDAAWLDGRPMIRSESLTVSFGEAGQGRARGRPGQLPRGDRAARSGWSARAARARARCCAPSPA